MSNLRIDSRHVDAGGTRAGWLNIDYVTADVLQYKVESHDFRLPAVASFSGAYLTERA